MKFAVCILISVVVLVAMSEAKAIAWERIESFGQQDDLKALSKLTPELLERLLFVSLLFVYFSCYCLSSIFYWFFLKEIELQENARAYGQSEEEELRLRVLTWSGLFLQWQIQILKQLLFNNFIYNHYINKLTQY